ncbi:EscF/YscF/HrpA family type III secretion system needle major subunit [Dokdonella sp. MW10]|uniref:EscF/YscF/HrpA family type III secretion system needle major subunit n=1 Tax=Dokdonella sp. MW10 TaxID=2992926 RepID=UPI003F806809
MSIGGGGNFLSSIGSIVGGIFGGPIGAMIGQMAGQLLSGIVDQAINNLPIDQPFKELISAGFKAGMGDVGGAIQDANEFIEQLGKATGGSQADIASLQRDVKELQDSVTDLFTKAIAQQGLEREDAGADGACSKTAGKGGAGGAAGWIRAMAEALGKQLDALADELQDAVDNIDKEDPSTMAEFQTISQQFSTLMNAATTAIKSIGEGMSSAVRKN